MLVGIAWLASKDRKRINWTLVGKGIAFQILLAVLIIEVDFVATGFDWVGKIFAKVISFTNDGSDFLMRSFIDGQVAPGIMNFAFYIWC